MHKLLTSIVLCFLAQAASAQCLNATTPTPVNASARPGIVLIATANAETRDGPVMRRTAAVTADGAVMRHTATTQSKPQSNDGEEHHRPTGAMLLAALALMTGIALRRASVYGQ